jgi:hypothetical protein
MAEKVIEIDQAQLARFARALEETQSVLGRDAYEAVVYASVFVARSAAAYSKPSKKRREIVDNPAYGRSRDASRKFRFRGGEGWAGSKYLINRFFQPNAAMKGRMIQIPTNSKSDKRAIIKNAGLMRNVWKSLQGLASSAKNRAAMDARDSKRLARLIVRTGNDETAVNMTNYLQYFEDAYGAGATSIILGNAASQLNFRINEKLGVTVDRANRP